MATEITIREVSGTELYKRYPGQTAAQPCHVLLDCRTGELSAAYDPEVGNARPMAVYDGHIQRWTVPCLRADAANALLRELAPLAARVVAGYASEWCGARRLARLDDDATAACARIDEICDDCAASVEDGDAVVAWDANDWLRAPGGSRNGQRRELGIDAGTSDAALASLADRLRDEAAADGVDVLHGLDEHLERLRDEADGPDPVATWTRDELYGCYAPGAEPKPLPAEVWLYASGAAATVRRGHRRGDGTWRVYHDSLDALCAAFGLDPAALRECAVDALAATDDGAAGAG